MKMLNVELTGTTPLLMNNNQGVNPLHPLTIELKKYTGKRKKTDEDNEQILKIKWLQSIYHSDATGPYVPAQNIEGALRDASKRSKRGKDAVIGLRVVEDMIPLQYDGPRDLESLSKDIQYCDIRVGKIKMASILLSRARFNRWKLAFKLEYDEAIFNQDEIADIFDVAGRYVGICDYRQRYGHFEAKVSSA